LEAPANWVSDSRPKESTFFWVVKFLFHGSRTMVREKDTGTQRERICFLFPENYENNKEKYEKLSLVKTVLGLERESVCVCV